MGEPGCAHTNITNGANGAFATLDEASASTSFVDMPNATVCEQGRGRHNINFRIYYTR
jgi:hypothetical protein